MGQADKLTFTFVHFLTFFYAALAKCQQFCTDRRHQIEEDTFFSTKILKKKVYRMWGNEGKESTFLKINNEFYMFQNL